MRLNKSAYFLEMIGFQIKSIGALSLCHTRPQATEFVDSILQLTNESEQLF